MKFTIVNIQFTWGKSTGLGACIVAWLNGCVGKRFFFWVWMWRLMCCCGWCHKFPCPITPNFVSGSSRAKSGWCDQSLSSWWVPNGIRDQLNYGIKQSRWLREQDFGSKEISLKFESTTWGNEGVLLWWQVHVTFCGFHLWSNYSSEFEKLILNMKTRYKFVHENSTSQHWV